MQVYRFKNLISHNNATEAYSVTYSENIHYIEILFIAALSPPFSSVIFCTTQNPTLFYNILIIKERTLIYQHLC